MRILCICGMLVTGLSITACSQHPLFDTSSLSENVPATSNQAIKTESSSVRTSALISNIPTVTGTVTLKQALDLGLLHDPSLHVQRLHKEALQARAQQAGSWSNPELEAEFENFAGSGESSGTKILETTISLAQTFPLGHDLAYMQQVAGHQVQLAIWDQQAARVALLTTVTQRYVQALASQKRLQQATHNLQLAQQVQSLTQKRVDAGVSPSVELMRAAVQIAHVNVQLKQAQRQKQAAYQQLALSWGQCDVTFDNLNGDLESLAALPSMAQLIQGIEKNPMIARWAVEISKRQAQFQLAKAQGIPDITGRLGYRQSNDRGDQALVFGVSLPLPLFNRNQGEQLAARLGSQSSVYEKRIAVLQLQQTLNQAYTQLATAHDMATALRDDALPMARKTFEMTRQTYQRGDVKFIDVIDAEQILNQLQTQYLDALTQYHEAVAWIEGLICQPISALSSESPAI
ncbi:MAG: TolC family protein [Phycisphaeraceae bacterium]|nr:TolC family protein [Phycisphaeraceae bacterium]